VSTPSPQKLSQTTFVCYNF